MKNIGSLLNKVEFLQDTGIGDYNRLDHIKTCILEKRKLYNSDVEYVQTLFEEHFEIDENPKQETDKPASTISCPKCGNAITRSANFCSFCGVPQQKYFDGEVFASRFSAKTFPFRFRFGINLYQLLAVLGGLAAIVPTAAAVYYLDRILFSIESYTGRDISGFTNLFVAAGAITSILCIFVIVVSFLIKKPKKVGRIMFFVSFAILVTSLGVGVVGFALILLAAIIALQRRY